MSDTPPSPLWTIYVVTNILNNKRYIGLTRQTLRSRWYGHCSPYKNNTLLNRAIRKYGTGVFTITALCHCMTHEDACFVERLLIFERHTMKPTGYNLTAGGDGTLSYKRPHHQNVAHSARMKRFYERHPEQRALIGDQHRGKTMSPEAREKIGAAMRLRGDCLTDDGRRRLSEARRARPMTEQQRAKISATLTGRKASEATKSKMSASSKGRPKTPEHRAAISAAQHRPDVKAKVRAANLGRKLSPEHRAAITAGNIRRWARQRAAVPSPDAPILPGVLE